ncbi:hypothetical protein FZEAL_7338 [Fusarium zealandicum]|uniref:Uncharacterized protein n=1 Tax=Fusarium zealandicum TaxID=1053134 RepID=A0A8H4XIY4_9HYPO|nr:hypothetical protein FZEAL_7338 [Fusarium zealandicum]
MPSSPPTSEATPNPVTSSPPAWQIGRARRRAHPAAPGALGLCHGGIPDGAAVGVGGRAHEHHQLPDAAPARGRAGAALHAGSRGPRYAGHEERLGEIMELPVRTLSIAAGRADNAEAVRRMSREMPVERSLGAVVRGAVHTWNLQKPELFA